MDPRTFLRPERPPLAPVPELGAVAPALPLPTASPSSMTAAETGAPSGRRPMLVVFLRHVGCPFAEATARAAHGPHLQRTELRRILVSHATPAATEKWRLGLRLPEAPTGGSPEWIDDEKGELYAAWGLGLTDLGHFLGPRSLLGVGRLLLRGIRNRHPSGTRWQRAGAFGLDRDHRLVYRHLPEHAADLPDLETAVRLLEPS